MSGDTPKPRIEGPRYDPSEVEPRWQRFWSEQRTFKATRHPGKKKRYLLDMFPYPSGSGLHVGHPEGYTATDIVARYARMLGEDVLHPMGWDSFGLPAEQYAIQTGTHPAATTNANIATFKRQLQMLGMSYDWDRELATTDPGYVRWTQWIFLKLFHRGLAYQDEIPVNWCAALGTVLANEEVVDGKSERGGHPVVRTPLRQWMLKITAYADRLAADLDGVAWPTGTVTMQREWIGKSEGAEITFAVDGHPAEKISVFTTRPDTLMGVSYVVLAPEHALVKKLATSERRASVDKYATETSSRSDRDRMAESKTKTGVATGAFALHPITGAKVPIWIADYVIGTYGTGAVMGVPGSDERDFAFASTFELPIVEVVSPDKVPHGTDAPFVDDGFAVNSGKFDGLSTAECKRAVVAELEKLGRGAPRTTYKLRDWVFSRQRYWGEPIPVYFPIELPQGGDPRKGAEVVVRFDQPIAVDEADLPLRLPDLEDFRPGDDPAGPLARALDWRFFEKDGKWFARETNTMPQWAGSCWYYLRFLDPKNDTEGWSKADYQAWMPVDLYVGGAEHGVLHLLYARFWHKVLFDEGLVADKEPFARLVHQGMILGEVEYTAYRDAAGKLVSASDVVPGDEEGFVHATTKAPVSAARVNEQDCEKRGSFFVLKEDSEIRVTALAHKMSKSRGNVINPDDIIREHGADALRLYEMSMGPLEAVKPWQSSQIQGVVRFRDRIFALTQKTLSDAIDDETKRLLHRTVKKVTGDIEAMSFHTAISSMMILTNHLKGQESPSREAVEKLVLLVSPFAPHLGEELWKVIGHDTSLAYAPWPTYEEALCVDDVVEMPVQVNGKVRGRVVLARTASEADAREAALAAEGVGTFVEGKTVKKFVYVPGKIANLVVG